MKRIKVKRLLEMLRQTITFFLKQIFIVSLVIEFSQTQTDFWKPSEGPYGAHLWKLKANSRGHLFATSYSRLFRSTDFGSTWRTIILDSMWVEGIGGICIDSSGRIFLGHNYGVIVSMDEGDNWQETGSMANPSAVRALIIDTLGTLFAGTWHQGFFRSSDLGKTWLRCSENNLTSLCFYINPNTNVILAGSQGGIYRSSDNGITWNFINLGNVSCTDFLKHPSGVLYVTSSTSTGGLHKSTDDGLTWTKLDSPLRYCESLIATQKGKIIVGSAWGMYASDDSGRTWTQTGLKNEIALTLCNNIDGRLYAGTGGSGVYVSSDEGETWHETNSGIIAAHIRSIAADVQGYVYVAWHKKIDRSSDFGTTFQQSFHSSSDEITTVTVDSKQRVYAIVMDTIFISTNHGSSWEVASATGIWQPPWALSVDPSDNLFIATRSAAVYRSTDQGHNWTNVHGAEVFAAFNLNIAFTSDGIGFFTIFDPNPPYGRIFRSTDQGFTWVEIAKNLNTNGIQSFCINQQGVIFLGTNGRGVLRSTDKGESWSETNTGLPSTDRWVRFIATAGNQLLVNTSSYYYPPGLTTYRSTDNGDSWFRESSGLPNDFVTALTVTPWGYFYIGTQFNGFYHSQLTVDAVAMKKEIRQYFLLQNYPNPFNPSTNISFSLPTKSLVSLKVFDVLGKEVAKLVSEELLAGNHSRQWNAIGMPSGVYYYRLVVSQSNPLQAGTFMETKKLILLR